MAEAVAIVGLVSSIATLVELSAKIVSRLCEFAPRTSEVPESFRSLSIRLPLLTATLQRIQTQVKDGQVPSDLTKAVTAVVNDTSEQILAVQTCLSRITPAVGASKLERAIKVLRSLAKEHKILLALEKIEKNNAILSFHQTTRNADIGDLVLAKLSEMTMISNSTSRSFREDELLALARATGKTILDELHPQMQSVLLSGNRELLSRFSQLPIVAQDDFRAQQEEQLLRFVEHEEARLLECLTAFDTRYRLADSRQKGLEGTCDWILQSPSYLEWLRGSCNRLWLPGRPGTGKTVMSAFITEALNGGLRDGEILAVYACSRADPQTTVATSILYGLAAQIAQSSPVSMEKCSRFLERHYSGGQLAAELLDVQDLIVEMSLSADIRRIFIVIDGLDEADWTEPEHLATIIDIPQYARKVKMLITSRQDPLIARALTTYSALSLDNAHRVAYEKDLAAFVDRELEHSKLVILPQHDLEVVKEIIIKQSHGLFIYAKLVIELLSDSIQDAHSFQPTDRPLVHSLPQSIDEVYKSKMLTIEAMNSAADAGAIKAYLRILATKTDLGSFSDLRRTAVEENSDIPRYTREELVKRAQGLIECDPESRYVRFASFSAKQYVLYALDAE